MILVAHIYIEIVHGIHNSFIKRLFGLFLVKPRQKLLSGKSLIKDKSLINTHYIDRKRVAESNGQ